MEIGGKVTGVSLMNQSSGSGRVHFDATALRYSGGVLLSEVTLSSCSEFLPETYGRGCRPRRR